MKKRILVREPVISKYITLSELANQYVAYEEVSVTIDYDNNLCIQYTRWETDFEYEERSLREAAESVELKQERDAAFNQYMQLRKKYGFI